MSIPTSGRPQGEPTRRYEAVPPAAVPPSSRPAAPATAVPARPETRLVVETGRFWAGGAATAFVAALVGVVGVIVLETILRLDLTYRDLFGTGSAMGAYIFGGILTAVASAALLQLLVLTTPRPRAFFGWILGLATVVATLLPFTWTTDVSSAIASGIVNLMLGIAVWSLLTGVLGWTVRRVAI